MRVTSGRVATAAMLLVGLAVLAVAGRLLPSVPSAQRPASTAATSAPVIRTAPGNTRGYAVPDVLGRTLVQAERVMRTGGLHGAAHERDPQGDNAVVVAQEPPAWVLVPPGSVVGFRTRTGVQPYGAPRRLRLGAGPRNAAYRIVAPDPATHQLTLAVVAPQAADVEVWLEVQLTPAGAGQHTRREVVLAQPRGGPLRGPSRHPGARGMDGERRQALSPAGSHPAHGHLHAGMTLRINRRENDRQELARYARYC